jgi:dinuclear metal center YbgI/SA1388 family protein
LIAASKTTVADIAGWMQQQAPLALSESWDNTGLLLGDVSAVADRIQTCLTLTIESVDEAIQKQAKLVIAHHPLPFKPISRITTDSQAGKLLWKLASNGIAVYSPHTAWDSAEAGINTMISARLGLVTVAPLTPCVIEGLQNAGSGRVGSLNSPIGLDAFCELVRHALPNCRLRGVDSGKPILRVAIACGSGGSLLSLAIRHNCDLFLTGEATFHTCLEAQAAGVSILLVGHFASEQFAMVELAKRLTQDFPKLICWASEQEKDPVRDFLMH